MNFCTLLKIQSEQLPYRGGQWKWTQQDLGSIKLLSTEFQWPWPHWDYRGC